jgi:hypothetical protein
VAQASNGRGRYRAAPGSAAKRENAARNRQKPVRTGDYERGQPPANSMLKNTNRTPAPREPGPGSQGFGGRPAGTNGRGSTPLRGNGGNNGRGGGFATNGNRTTGGFRSRLGEASSRSRRNDRGSAQPASRLMPFAGGNRTDERRIGGRQVGSSSLRTGFSRTVSYGGRPAAGNEPQRRNGGPRRIEERPVGYADLDREDAFDQPEDPDSVFLPPAAPRQPAPRSDTARQPRQEGRARRGRKPSR